MAYRFWATVCKTVRPMLLDCCLSCPVLSVYNVGVLWPNGWMDQDETWHAGMPLPWPHCVRWGPSSPSPKGARPPFSAHLLRPNGCMNQDATWYGGTPQHTPHCVRRDPAPSPKRSASPSIFGPCLLCPNGWMDQDGTWHGGGPWSRPHCAKWGPSCPPQKRDRGAHQFSAHSYCGQTAGCIKMPLGMEVGLSRGDCVRLEPSPLPKKV